VGGFVQKGLVIVFTGNGKGKTTAALGMALRAAGHGMRVLILQFIKGSWRYGELDALARFPEIEIRPLGTGFTWKKESLDEDRVLAEQGWAGAAGAIQRGEVDMIVLDELNIVLAYGLLPLAPVLQVLSARPPGLHVVITGRGAPQGLLDAADLVTEMQAVKHPYHDQGIAAQKGVEF
jgi:cob(I)alamin adenosyltransferase